MFFMFFDQSQEVLPNSWSKRHRCHGPMASKFHACVPHYAWSAVMWRDLDGWHWRWYFGHIQTSKFNSSKAHIKEVVNSKVYVCISSTLT